MIYDVNIYCLRNFSSAGASLRNVLVRGSAQLRYAGSLSRLPYLFSQDVSF
jgi:hypothetical protein